MTAGNGSTGPDAYRTAVTLRDGSALLLRSIRPEDEDRLLALFYRLSRHTVYMRFHHVLTHISREEAVRSVKAYRLLEGWRGSKPADTEAVEGLLLRISAMVEDLFQIQEFDLNPVKVLEGRNGYVVIDARDLLAGSPAS